MHVVEFVKLNAKLKFVFKSDDAFQRYRGLKIDLSGNFDSVFLVLKIVQISH